MADGSRFVCPCEQCDLELASTACAWTLQGDLTYGFQTGVDAVFVVAPDGGSSKLSEVATGTACGNSSGWYAEGTKVAEYTYTTLTFRLCPASCSDHQGDAGVRFVLRRSGCPIFR